MHEIASLKEHTIIYHIKKTTPVITLQKLRTIKYIIVHISNTRDERV
jgi:hypothetical protein